MDIETIAQANTPIHPFLSEKRIAPFCGVLHSDRATKLFLCQYYDPPNEKRRDPVDRSSRRPPAIIELPCVSAAVVVIRGQFVVFFAEEFWV